MNTGEFDKLSLARFKSVMECIHRELGAPQRTVSELTASIKISEQTNDVSALATALMERGNIHILRNEYKAAYTKLRRCLTLFTKIEDKLKCNNTLITLANISILKGQYFSSYQYLQNSLITCCRDHSLLSKSDNIFHNLENLCRLLRPLELIEDEFALNHLIKFLSRLSLPPPYKIRVSEFVKKYRTYDSGEWEQETPPLRGILFTPMEISKIMVKDRLLKQSFFSRPILFMQRYNLTLQDIIAVLAALKPRDPQDVKLMAEVLTAINNAFD